jgi:hypothetical protein
MKLFCLLVFAAGKVGNKSYTISKQQTAKARRKDILAKKEGVTKIGNNMYFYTGCVP